MNTNKKKYISIMYILTILSFVIFICINTTTVYAENPSADAPVSTNTDTVAQGSTRNAPVSISVYSDIITESADTYDYNNAGIATLQPTVVPTAAPTDVPSSLPAETAEAPQGTGSPDATPEPDMISYPPTVAPAYTD